MSLVIFKDEIQVQVQTNFKQKDNYHNVWSYQVGENNLHINIDHLTERKTKKNKQMCEKFAFRYFL